MEWEDFQTPQLWKLQAQALFETVGAGDVASKELAVELFEKVLESADEQEGIDIRLALSRLYSDLGHQLKV